MWLYADCDHIRGDYQWILLYWKAARRLIATYTVSSSSEPIKSWSKRRRFDKDISMMLNSITIRAIHPWLSPIWFSFFSSMEQSLSNMQFTIIQYVSVTFFLQAHSFILFRDSKATRKLQSTIAPQG